MEGNLPIEISRMKKPDETTVKQIVHIYLEAYKNDTTVQLQHTVPSLIESMTELIKIRADHPACEFIIAKTEDTDRIVGWLALAFNHTKDTLLREEHVLLAQYALIPDSAIKWNRQGITLDKIKTIAHEIYEAFKEAREQLLPDKHCIISALVVDPEFQGKGIASALLTRAIALTEVFLYPIWVQTPAAYQSLFEKHDFQEVGEYRFDPNQHVPTPDDNDKDKDKGKGKGKVTALPPLQKHVWKYMLRQKPLEEPLSAYNRSKAYADAIASMETEAESIAELTAKLKTAKQLRLPEEDMETNWISRIFRRSSSRSEGRGEEEPGSLIGGDVPTATTDVLTAAADPDAGIGPSTPLLGEPGTDEGQKATGMKYSTIKGG